ncbi:hypothetical protein B9Q13_05935 [Candidatus Marsarchaeota G2 archaeon ECH_B_SAG-G16]|uniref:Transposase putative helix-turn-helix domain-containing protein n=1 Tax=Candidatus Marsarchaeota G2 archaeon ECH_B_SAG-G16 TaxID=1978167 RepID=A0A2R6BZ94_9ARCH|nr:MAG: hypothetical protein B9Q13_05935 [Candidatus Marsarchaeota G2 archaeon ECH_B_SAG-G16]
MPKKQKHDEQKRAQTTSFRFKNPEFQALHSQVTWQVTERFYQARQRFFEGEQNQEKQVFVLGLPTGWKFCDTKSVRQKHEARLFLSKIRFYFDSSQGVTSEHGAKCA